MALLSQREIKISVAVTLLLALLAVLITLLVFWFREAPEEPEKAGAARKTERPVAAGGEGYNIFRLRVPGEYRGIFRPHWIPYRERHDSWASSQIEPYWIDPRTLVEEELEKETDESVQRFLEELP